MNKPKKSQRFRYEDNDNKTFNGIVLKREGNLLGFHRTDREYDENEMDWIIWRHEECRGLTTVISYNKNITFEE